MLRKDFIYCKTRALLSEFLAPMLEVADKPRKKFLHQIVGAIVTSGSLVVSELCWWTSDRCSDSFHSLKRLLNHLVSPRADMAKMVKSYRSRMSNIFSMIPPFQ